MALMVLELIKLPLPQFITKMPKANPFVIGILFALVSSPCSSPVLFGMLSLASGTGSIPASVLIMFVFSLGYTAIIFFASLFAGLMKQLNWFKARYDLMTNLSAFLLGLIGLVYIYIGIRSF